MSRILTIAVNDLRLMLKDRSSLFWVFIAPFLWVGLFGHISGSNDASAIRISLGVVMGEETPLATHFRDLLEAENFDLTRMPPQAADAGAAGEAADEAPPRTLTIPAGFEEAVRARKEIHLRFFQKKDANAQASFAAKVAIHRAVVRLLAGEALGGMKPEDDLIRVESSWAGVRKVPSGLDQAMPGNLVMFVMLSTLIYGSAVLATERRRGTVARLATTPATRSDLILGKLGGRALVASVQVAVFLAMGFTLFRVDWGSSPLGLAAVLVPLILCAGAFGLLGGTLFSSPEASAGIAVVMSLVMSAMGGCWWPMEILPRWLQAVGHAFPTAWAMDGLHEIMAWGGGVGDVIGTAAVLLLFALGAFALAVRRLDPAA
ncbi:MAG TPA: ABC transporter permease [Candidatus Saccharimonadales bacterium]|nr:ABC transporter permease [Candidatus Saccharimonadales bacterium]